MLGPTQVVFHQCPARIWQFDFMTLQDDTFMLHWPLQPDLQ
mgnify:CR=1 FL=1